MLMALKKINKKIKLKFAIQKINYNIKTNKGKKFIRIKKKLKNIKFKVR